MRDKGCGMWDEGCGMWDVGCELWDVGECGTYLCMTFYLVLVYRVVRMSIVADAVVCGCHYNHAGNHHYPQRRLLKQTNISI